LSNLAEYQAGTIPTNATSVLRLTADVAGNELHLSFAASSNQTYSLQQAPGLASGIWINLIDIPARPTNYTYQATNAVTGRSFYRVVTPVP
jgi:hypothetical protein